MPYQAQNYSEYLEHSGDRGYKSELQRSEKKHQASKTVKHRVVSPCKDRYVDWQYEFQIEKPSAQPIVELCPEPKQNSRGEILFQRKYLGDQRRHLNKNKASKDDELVKYMSSVPGYLQRIEKGEKHQEKALNFGVLDWERLEKWKHKQMFTPARHSMNASSTNASSGSTPVGSYMRSTARIEVPVHQNKQHASFSFGPEQSHDGTKVSRTKVKHVHELETGLRAQEKLQRACKSFGDKSSSTMIDNEKRKDLEQRVASETGTSSSSNNGVAHRSKKNMSSCNGEIKRAVEGPKDLDFEFSSPHCPDKQQNIVLLLPRDLPRNSCSELLGLSDPRSSDDKNMYSASRKSFSDAFFARKGHRAELYSEVSHSCPLPSRAETKSQGMELPLDSHQASTHKERSSEGKNTQENKSKAKVLTLNLFDTAKRLDREFSETTATKVRTPSPNRRFGIGKMSRSFSLKETPAVPQISTYVTVKSGPLSSDISPRQDEPNREKAHGHSRGRSSPLRRLLDPILKPKASTTHSAENHRPLGGKLNSPSSGPCDTREPVLNGRQATSVHALLQFTVKNGLPLFKFVVDDNESDILATTVKKLSQSGKDDLSWIYTFYSVRETKKKKSGGWIHQGSKGKSSGYAYNIVGQMKVSHSRGQKMAMESVLFGAELEHPNTNKEILASSLNRELAAIVSNNKNVRSNRERTRKHGDLTEKGCTGCECNSEGSLHNMTVILPVGFHGLPNEGLPSSLIDRWKSGGSCDCGGWDIGCKLRVLSPHSACHKVLGMSKASDVTDRFDLFLQGGNQENMPIFSLVPLKSGIYSVKFNSSISLLQAFSVCIAVMNNEVSDLTGVGHPPEAQRVKHPTSGGLHRTSPSRIRGESPVRYVSYPPYSPVGRV